MLYQDEATFYRQPSQGWLWSYMGRRQPRMPYSHRSNTRLRQIGYVNAVTGALHGEDFPTITAARLAANVRQISKWYPDAKTIYLVWDNWPVHDHPKVLAALASQPRVKLLKLPTYAPWLSPIEKVWRYVRQAVSHAHPWSDDFRVVRQTIRDQFAQFAAGSPQLLRYIGLST